MDAENQNLDGHGLIVVARSPKVKQRPQASLRLDTDFLDQGGIAGHLAAESFLSVFRAADVDGVALLGHGFFHGGIAEGERHRIVHFLDLRGRHALGADKVRAVLPILREMRVKLEGES